MPALPDMSGKTVLVTGASSGIGLETAAALAQMGAMVVMTARDPAKGEAAMAGVGARSGSERVELLMVDFASVRSIRELATEFGAKYQRLDVLVNNAGAYNARRSVTADGYEMTFGVNHLGYFLLTDLLLDLLKASAPSRIVNVSSGAHLRAAIDFDDLNGERSYGGLRAYSQSKLANVLFTYELARRLEGSGVTANCMHPGFVRSGFGLNNGGAMKAAWHVIRFLARPVMLTPAQGAETAVYLASSPEVEGVSGKYFVKKKAVPSSAISYDEDVARRLWEVSEEMTQRAAASS